MKGRLNFYCLILLATLITACTNNGTQSTIKEEDADTNIFAKRAWIAKTSRTLRYGKEVSRTEMADLISKNREEIVDQFLSDNGFGDTVLDFNLYYLGFKPDVLFTEFNGARRYDFTAVSRIQAITSAVETLNNGDFFSLFKPMETIYLAQRVNQPSAFGIEGIEGLTPDEIRLKLIEKHHQAIDETIAAFTTEEGVISKEAGCLVFNNQRPTQWVGRTGLPFEIVGLFNQRYLNRLNSACFTEKTTAEQMIADLQVLKPVGENLMRASLGKEPTNGQFAGIHEFEKFNLEGTGIKSEDYHFGNFNFWNAIPNSSTNYNRTRAAYILKTYLCDDLTPVNVVLPDEDHGEDLHAADPGCQACHYKLDPMAGFFRYRGQFGTDFENQPMITFDDQRTFEGDELAHYLSSWKSRDESREWEVGFIRSRDPRHTRRNKYGSSLSDMLKIISESKEAKECVVKRMTEYFLGPDTIYDGGWVAHLTKTLDRAETSGVGFKKVVKEIVLGKTFTHPDPDPTQCYDFAPGDEASGIPCEVAYILRRNCESCHEGDIDNGGLDVTQWITLENGAKTFFHVDEDENQKDRLFTLQEMIDRISSNDPAFAMPYRKFMTATDRATLFRWLNNELNASENNETEVDTEGVNQ